MLQVHIPLSDTQKSEENLTLCYDKVKKCQNGREYVQNNEVPNYTVVGHTESNDWMPYSTQNKKSVSFETFLNSKPIASPLCK